MYFEILKKAGLVAASAVALIGAGSVQAADIYYQGNVVSAANNIEFTGDNVDMTQGSLSLTCTLTLIGDIVKNSAGGADITVDDGDVTGSFLSGCNNVTLNFPWNATVDAADAPDPAAGGTTLVTFENVSVTTSQGTCEGSLTATYTNGATVTNNAASSFQFADSFDGCTVEGTIYTQSPYSSNDVDVY